MVFINKRFREGKVKLSKNGKPYIRKICDISEIGVWLVDGEYVRKNICEDFVNFDHHYHLSFIPKNEFWIAKEAKHNETRFYIDRMLAERRMMAAGSSLKDAKMKGEIVERGERSKSRMMKRLGSKKIHRKEALDRVRKKLLRSYGRYGRKLRIWVVNGELVRSFFYIDFAGGGHDKVFHFIPDREVWLDDDISLKERKFILLHELYERRLMAGGQKYPRAHLSATKTEDFFRHYPKGIGKAIGLEIRKQQ